MCLIKPNGVTVPAEKSFMFSAEDSSGGGARSRCPVPDAPVLRRGHVVRGVVLAMPLGNHVITTDMKDDPMSASISRVGGI